MNVIICQLVPPNRDLFKSSYLIRSVWSDYRRGVVVVRMSALLLVDVGTISLSSRTKKRKQICAYSFPA